MSGFDFFLNKNVNIVKKDNWKLYGLLVDYDEHFIFLRFKDGSLKAISKDNIEKLEVDTFDR